MKQLRKARKVNDSTVQLYSVCFCSCSGCGSVPSDDFVNVKAWSFINAMKGYK